MRSSFLLLLIAVITACSPFKPDEPIPVLQVLDIAITPALRPLTDALQTCAAEQEDVILNIIETPTTSLADAGAALYIRLGEPQNLPVFAAALAWEEVVVVVHPSNAADGIDISQIRAYYSDLSNPSAQSEVHPLVVLAGDETRLLFDQKILQNAIISPFAQLVPGPDAVLDIVSTAPQAIGYVPRAWDLTRVHVIEFGLFLPVLVLGEDEPSAQEVKLISCLQGDVGQELILEKYIEWGSDPTID